MSDRKPVLEIRDVSKIYKMGESEVRALDNVSLTIDEGEFVAILGASGSGKSTLMHIIGFMDQASKGKILLDGEDLSRLGERRRATVRGTKIGFVFQAFNLLSRLTVLENTMLPLQYQQVSSSNAKKRAREVLELVGLGDRVKHYPNQLSGGQRQRVAIARALVNDPRLILADEPTGNLDTENANLILNVLRQLHAESSRTVIIVTHDPKVAEQAKRRITVVDGKILD
ncbi:MAG: putative ABC transport system ATP-binding protein [Verrucomicrobiales bacterium]|jgi:putative ABC transport system ATP-binding protein